MKKIIFSAFIFSGLFLCANFSRAEVIDNFESNIAINPDASIDVSEKIFYDFGAAEKHGIFRTIPVSYKARGGNYNLSVSDISVTDEQGGNYNFTTANSGNNLEIKIGDADKLVSGKKVYVISYAIGRAINYFDTWDELYWNATGDAWPVEISQASANIFLPAKVDPQNIQKKCFFGAAGSTTECSASVTEENGKTIIHYEYQKALAFGEGLTIVGGFPKGIVTQPSARQNFWETMKDNWILFLPLAVFVFMFRRWWVRGRDPQGRGTIIAQFDAPDNLTPAEVGMIIDEKADNKDISSTIIQLAVLGYLKISKIKKEGFFLDSEDYYFDKLKSDANLPNDFEKKIMQGIFNGKESAKLSDLKDSFYKDLATIKDQGYQAVVVKGYFTKNPNSVRMLYIGIGIGIIFLCGFFGAAIFGGLAVLGGLLSGIIVMGFGWAMPARTKKGVEAREHILGLKEYLSVAEKDRIKFHNAPEKNPERFEKLLPYAMVLGVEKEWAKQFEGIYNQQPSWYSDSSSGAFNALILTNSLGNFFNSASAAIASTPASSGGSGFSGGSSGGGFGGGGGGSW